MICAVTVPIMSDEKKVVLLTQVVEGLVNSLRLPISKGVGESVFRDGSVFACE